MFSRPVFFVCLMLLPAPFFGQENTSNFKAFGVLPTEVPHSLYQQLNLATSPILRLQYLDTIAKIFITADLEDSVLAYGQEMKQLASSLDPTERDRNVYLHKAYYYEAMGKREIGLLDDAIATFLQAIDLPASQSSIDQHLKLGLAETYLMRKQEEKAYAILEKLDGEDDPALHLAILMAMGNYFFQQGDTNKAQVIYEKVRNSPQVTNYPKQALRARINRAMIRAEKGAVREAISEFIVVKEDALADGFYDLYIKATLNEGRMYSFLKEYDIAEVALNMAYVNAVSWNRLQLQREVIRALTQVYVMQNDFKNAYALMTQDEAINEMITSRQNKLQLRDLELKYETLQKERRIESLEKGQVLKQAEIDQQKTIKNAVVIGFFIILIPIILLLVVYYQKLQAQSLLSSRQEEWNQQEMQSLLQSQELELIRTAISAQNEERGRIARELHDSIGGNLAAIKLQMHQLARTNSPEWREIVIQLDTTYQQVREISHSLIPTVLREQPFVHLVSAFITKLSVGESMKLTFHAYPEEAVNAIALKIQVELFNLIKELITNALKHAKAHLVSIQLSVVQEEHTVDLLYEDDGVGFNPEKTSRGIGLNNMMMRINAVQGSMAIDSTPDHGTVISISIPIS